MPVIPQNHRISEGGLPMFLGAQPRPHDPAEAKYHFARLMRPRGTVDLTKPRLLSDFDGKDHRIPITNQGQLGACTAFTGLEVNAMLAGLDGTDNVLIHPGWLYEACRKKEGTWPQDAGAFEADALDILLAEGAPPLSATQYVDQAGYDYASIDVDISKSLNYVATHLPFHPADGNILENIWTALDLGQPVAIATAWLEPFFNPSGGKLPDGANPANVAGGHEISCWGIVPNFVLCSNHWTTSWSADAPTFGYTMRPGDFAIPWSYFQAPAAQNIIWECRAVTATKLQPKPDPNPQPQPNPNPQPNPQPQPSPTPSAQDKFWQWIQADSTYYVGTEDETARAQGASVIARELPLFYPSAARRWAGR
jgi:hypothetical protein